MLLGCSDGGKTSDADKARSSAATPADKSSATKPETSQFVGSGDEINDLSEQASQAAQDLVDDALILRPNGVGRLRLGMPGEQVTNQRLCPRQYQGSSHDGWNARMRSRPLRCTQSMGGTPGGSDRTVIVSPRARSRDAVRHAADDDTSRDTNRPNMLAVGPCSLRSPRTSKQETCVDIPAGRRTVYRMSTAPRRHLDRARVHSPGLLPHSSRSRPLLPPCVLADCAR